MTSIAAPVNYLPIPLRARRVYDARGGAPVGARAIEAHGKNFLSGFSAKTGHPIPYLPPV